MFNTKINAAFHRVGIMLTDKLHADLEDSLRYFGYEITKIDGDGAKSASSNGLCESASSQQTVQNANCKGRLL